VQFRHLAFRLLSRPSSSCVPSNPVCVLFFSPLPSLTITTTFSTTIIHSHTYSRALSTLIHIHTLTSSTY
jgi:hypothetical protein